MELFKYRGKEYKLETVDSDNKYMKDLQIPKFTIYDENRVIYEIDLLLPLKREQIEKIIDDYIKEQRKNKIENIKK